MKRREFITLLGGAAAAYPLAAHGQPERMRRVGVLMHTSSDEPESQTNIAAFLQGLQEAGWAIGRNLRIDYRWSAADRASLRRNAGELVALGPDVILAGPGATTGTLREINRTVPIVFAQNIDPVGNGNVESLSRPGTNATGFTQFEYSLSAKWLELLREIAPEVKRVAELAVTLTITADEFQELPAPASTLKQRWEHNTLVRRTRRKGRDLRRRWDNR